MRKIVVLFVMLVSCVNMFGFDLCDKHDNECIYVKANGKKCSSWKQFGDYCHYHSCVVKTEQKRIEKYGTAAVKEKVELNHLQLSGKYLQTSANLQYAAIGCAVVGGGVAAFTAKDNPKVAMGVGIGMGVASLVCEVVSISYKYKSGNELIISGSSIKYNF